ncbi:hypothetical protein JTB14_005457 [Gonioctena quinquepunctata]|nr:hypothetical protein JTB14_005457 [Gonioctena quinquepunctata]
MEEKSKMKGLPVAAFIILTLQIMGSESKKCCDPHARWFECKPCHSVPCGTTPPDICIEICIHEPGCYCEEGYRVKNGECVLPRDC